MKIYTRTGDDGTTGVLGPGRRSKADPRIEAYGTVDELNAALGVARSLDAGGWLGPDLERIQRQLFQLGAELATTEAGLLAKLDRLGAADVEGLEAAIDRHEEELPPLTHFLLPAGTALASQLHVARTVCRRAERRVVVLGAGAGPIAVRYLNRLADLLFVLARWCNHRAGVTDAEWRPAGR
jgi:cob(I)alamin adenosyltransferase